MNFYLECATGYQRIGIDCVDIDECAPDLGTCDSNALCTNTIGSYDCVCNEGYYGYGEECTSCRSSVAAFKDMTVNCAVDTIDVAVPYCAFWNMEITNPRFLGQGDNCTVVNDGVNYDMKIPVSRECGTQVSLNGTHIVYANAVTGTFPPRIGDVGERWTRKMKLELAFSCGFQNWIEVNANVINVIGADDE